MNQKGKVLLFSIQPIVIYFSLKQEIFISLSDFFPVKPTPAHASDITFREAAFALWTRLGFPVLCSMKTAMIYHCN